MGIFDDDDSDVGSETSYYSDASVESFGEPEPGSSSWLRVSKTSTSFKGKNVAHFYISDDEEELRLGSPQGLRDGAFSLRKRPPSTRPTVDHHIEHSTSFSTANADSPTAPTPYYAAKDGYTTPACSQSNMASSMLPPQISQSPIVNHVRANLPTLLNGSPTRLTRSTSFSNCATQGPTTTVAPVQLQPFSEYAYAPQTAIGPSHFQGSPIPRYPNQTTPGPSQYNQAAFSPHLYNQSTPASYHYNQATPSPHYYNQATSGHHNHCTPQGSHFVNTAAPYYPVNQHSSPWSSTPSTSQAASSSTTSASSFEVESNMTQEVYDAVGRYLEKDSDPKRIATKKLLQEEDKTSCPEWHQLYSFHPIGQTSER
ncbi:hypothetical protein F5H01DRAFT_411859 [Linnemannia elongata]|nr:hypothetical protein F5H01DRAFT_411859 [Linnemannia elongata]